MQENVLVTGGAGFIGSFIVDALLAAGHRVRVLDNLEPQVHGGLRAAGAWPAYCSPGAEYVLGDVRDRHALQTALRDVDVVFHQAAMVGVGQSMYQVERYVDVNTRGTALLLDILANESAIRQRVRKLVVASSMSIYGEGKYACPTHGVVYPRMRPAEQLAVRDWEMRCPQCGQHCQALPTDEDKPLHSTSIYAIAKKDQEEMCLTIGRAYSIPTVALRYFNVYGPRQALSNPYTGVAAIFSSRLLNGRPPVIYEDGAQCRDFVHVTDIARANLLAMQCAGMDYGAFNVGTGRRLAIRDIADALTAHLFQAAGRGGAPQPEIQQKFRAGDIRHCFADIQRIAGWGFAPQVRFEDGVAELVEWVRRQTAEDGFERARQELAQRGLAL